MMAMIEANELGRRDFESKVREPRKLELTDKNRVLIVEDDVSLANLLTTVLQDASPDISIDWATSGEEAERYLEEDGELFGHCPYDLIIADIFLEGEITGLDIWRKCNSIYPDTNILVTSSLPVGKFVSCLKDEQACPEYLAKPFSLAECREAVSAFMTEE